MRDLSQTLETVARRIARYRSKGINEQDTKASLIQPVLRVLGWDVEDLDDVQREYKRRRQDKQSRLVLVAIVLLVLGLVGCNRAGKKVVGVDVPFEVFFVRAENHAASEKYDDAISEMDELLQLIPGQQNAKVKLVRARAYNLRGQFYSHKGDQVRALNDFHEAIALNPDQGESYVYRAGVYHDTGKNDDAIKDYSVGIDLSVTGELLSAAHFNRGILYQKKGEYDKAIDDFTETANLDPRNAQAYFHRGSSHFTKGLDKVQKRLVGERMQLRRDGVVNQNDQQKVLDVVERSMYFEETEFDRAMADFTKAIELNPGYAEAYYGRGMIYQQRGQEEKAEADATQAFKLNPDLRK